MKPSLLLALGTLVLNALTACSVSNAPSPPAPTITPVIEPRMSEQWRIEFNMSGGFAGIMRSAELSNTGQLTVTDEKAKKRVTAQVPEAELMEIASLITQIQPAQPGSILSNCRDCFRYRITIRRDGEQFFFQCDDTTLDKSGLAPLINTLAHLLDRALSGQLKP